jgi:hypothetical protein
VRELHPYDRHGCASRDTVPPTDARAGVRGAVSAAVEERAAPLSRRRPPVAAWLPIAVVVLLLLFGLLFYGEARYRSCIERAEAEFPAVPVSSFNQRATGPLKVSFVEERARALEECGRF